MKTKYTLQVSTISPFLEEDASFFNAPIDVRTIGDAYHDYHSARISVYGTEETSVSLRDYILNAVQFYEEQNPQEKKESWADKLVEEVKELRKIKGALS